MQGQTSTAPLRSLLARYLAGEIEESFWHSIMSVLDSGQTGQSERKALVAFLQDAMAEPRVARRPRPARVACDVAQPAFAAIS